MHLTVCLEGREGKRKFTNDSQEGITTSAKWLLLFKIAFVPQVMPWVYTSPCSVESLKLVNYIIGHKLKGVLNSGKY